MVKTRLAPVDESSSSDESLKSEEEEELMEDENKKPVSKQSSLPLESEEDEYEDFEMHGVASPCISNFIVKPSSTSEKVDDSSRKTKKSSKRPLESSRENAKGSSKKKGKSSSAAAENKPGSNRLWSEDDEIAIVKGMIDYESNNGTDPLSDAADFQETIRDSLHVDVSLGQLVDKIRKLRRKYQNNAEKGENGHDPVFSKPHESQLYELSKRIWGFLDDSKSKGKKQVKDETSSEDNVTMDDKMEEKEEAIDKDFWKKYTHLEIPFMGEEFVKEATKMIGGSKANEFEEKWRKLKVEEVELHLKKVELISEQTKFVIKAFKSSLAKRPTNG